MHIAIYDLDIGLVTVFTIIVYAIVAVGSCVSKELQFMTQLKRPWILFE